MYVSIYVCIYMYVRISLMVFYCVGYMLDCLDMFIPIHMHVCMYVDVYMYDACVRVCLLHCMHLYTVYMCRRRSSL